MTTSRERGCLPSRDAVASASGAAVYSLSLGIASVALPLLALRAGYSASEIGALTAVSAVAQMLTRLGLGSAMRRWPDWTLIAGASLLLAVSNGALALSAALVPFVLAEVLQGVSRACFWTGSQTHAVRGSERAAGALATVNLVSSVGLLAGPVVAGVLSERTPVLALVVAATVAVLAVGPTLLLDRLPPFVPPADRPPGRLWRRPGVSVGCWAGVTAGAWRGLLTSYVPVALDAARQTSSAIGVLVSIANAASMAGAAVGGRLRRSWSHRGIGLGIVATGAATAATAAVASHLVLAAVVLSLSGLAAGAIQVLGPAVAAESVHPEERGEAIAATGTFRAAALFAAPLAVAGLVALVPLAPAVALVGAAMTLPALTVRRRLSVRGAV